MVRVRVLVLVAAVAALVAAAAFVAARHRPLAGRRPIDVALADAVHRDDERLVTLLLHKGADPNARDASGITPAEWALAEGRSDTSYDLLEAGARVNLPFHLDQAILHQDW